MPSESSEVFDRRLADGRKWDVMPPVSGLDAPACTTPISAKAILRHITQAKMALGRRGEFTSQLRPD